MSSLLVIPKELSPPQFDVYEKLIGVAKNREGGQKPRPLVVITDVGKDYDDLAALVVLKEFHRLGLVELRAVVANLIPAPKRAHLAKAALKSLGLRGVPVACGTRGSPEDHEVLDHEFNEPEFSRSDFKALRNGQELLLKVYRSAQKRSEKLHLLCLSSLQDIDQFASKYPGLVAKYTAEVHMQGGNYISKEGNLEPDCKAANNRFNLDAAKKWHLFNTNERSPQLYLHQNRCICSTFTSDVFVELKATGHPIGAYLRRVQVEQDLAFYKRACESDPKKRFAPFMDQEWFLANKTNWHQRRMQRKGDALPIGQDVIPYLTKLVVYDAQAALGEAEQDVVAALKVFQSRDRSTQGGIQLNGTLVTEHHWIIGDERSTAVPEEISLALSALLKGSLLIAQEEMGLRTEQQEHTKCIPRISFVKGYSRSSRRKLVQNKLTFRSKALHALYLEAVHRSKCVLRIFIETSNGVKHRPLVEETLGKKTSVVNSNDTRGSGAILRISRFPECSLWFFTRLRSSFCS